MNKIWIVYLLAFGCFVMATSEMVVAGILGMIAKDTNVSVGVAGQLVTVYAAVFAVASPLLLALASKMERKKLLLLSLVLFIVGNLIAFLTPNFSILLVSRVVLAASAGVFTVVALTVGSNLVAPERRGNAIGIIIMGFSTALVLGVPLGTLVGEYWNWRLVFMLIAILSILAFIGMAAFVPRMDTKDTVSLKAQAAALKNKRMISGLLITFFWIIGYQFVFTYISPFLQQSAGLNTTMISVALFICGIFAVVGSRIGGYGADRWGTYRTLLFSILLHAVALILLPWVATSFVGALCMLAIWIGAAWTTTPAQQYYLVSLSPESAGLALGLNNSVLQLGIAVGAGVGGWVVTQTSFMHISWFGALSIIFSLLAVLYSFSFTSSRVHSE